jgi:hypothetical protein
VVWEDGKMNKSEYRKFKVMTVLGVDDFASMREVVGRRYRRILDNSESTHESTPAPSKQGFVTGQDFTGLGKTIAGAGFETGHDFSRAESDSIGL